MYYLYEPYLDVDVNSGTFKYKLLHNLKHVLIRESRNKINVYSYDTHIYIEKIDTLGKIYIRQCKPKDVIIGLFIFILAAGAMSKICKITPNPQKNIVKMISGILVKDMCVPCFDVRG